MPRTRPGSPSSPRSATTPTRSSTTWATRFSSRPTRTRRTGRSSRFDPRASGAARWRDVVPEKPEAIETASTAGGRLFVTYLKDVTTRVYVHALDGTLENQVELPGRRYRQRPRRQPRRRVHLLHVHVVHQPVVDLPVRHRHAEVHALPRAGHPGLQGRRLRHAAGVLHEQGRHARPDVHRAPQGPEARRQQPHADVRLRRLQREHDAELQLAAPGAARAGRRVRVGEPARRRRVRRDVAPGGHEAEETERLRRLHRRGRVARSATSTPRRRGWRFRARRTAGCWSAPSPISGRICSPSWCSRPASWTCCAFTSSRSAGTGSPTTDRATTKPSSRCSPPTRRSTTSGGRNIRPR